MSTWAPHFDPSARPGPGAFVFAFRDGEIALAASGAVPRLEQLPADVLDGARPLCIGVLDGTACFAVELGRGDVETVRLRELYARAPEPLAALAGRASQALEWDRAHAFCGRCGSPTEPSESEPARICTACDAAYYPRINPAVIMLVERGDRMLLGRRHGFDSFSTLAGFVEAGETLEQAVVREVEEEVGLAVEDVRYFGSQPWPFPSQLMVAFVAHAAAGELRLEEDELAEVRWFARGDELPPIPPPFTIARHLIDDFLARGNAA